MNLKSNLVSFLTSSILAFLADYFGLGRLTRQLLSFVAVRHLLPAPPPSHTISYTEPPPTAAESAQNDEEPFIYTGSRFHTTWIPPDSPVYGFNWYLILVLTTVMFFFLVRLALHLYSSYMTRRCTTLPQRNLLDLAFSEEYEEIKEYPPSTPEPLSMTSVLRAIRLALNSSTSVALESVSRLDVFYPYIAGFSRWTSSRGHFSSVADMTMVNYAGDQGSEHAGDSIESENCSVVSVVSGVTDDLEDEEGSLLPDFAEESGSSLAQPLSVETGGALIQEPITEIGSTPALSSTAIVDAQEASTSSYEEFDAPRETNTSEVPPLPQVSSEPASSHALASEPSVLQFELGEFFASPPARPQDGASDAAAGGSSVGALQLDGPEHAGLGVASEPSVQFDLGEFFAAPKSRPAEAQEISLVVSPLTSPDLQPPSATTADPLQSAIESPSTDLQPSQGSSLHASVAHLDGFSKILDSNASTASEDAVLPLDAGRDTSSDVSADSSVLTGRNREDEPVLVVPSISIDLDTLSESAGAEDSVQAKDLANEALGSDTCDGDSSGLGIDIGSSSFPRYEHGSPLFAIIEDSELSQEHISAPNSPAVRLEDPPLLVLSPNPDCESPPLLTPHELGGAFSTNPEDIHSPQDEADPDFEVFNSSTLPAEFPLIRKELAAVEAIDEDIDDWDWTLLNVALHEQFSVVCPRSTAVTQQAVDSGSICDDPFLASSPVRPSDSSSSSEVKVNLEENSTTDHQRASSESITRCEQVRSEAMIGVMPLALTAEQAQDFSRVCGNYGLILPGGSACALYQAAAWDRLSFAEARLLKAAAKRPKQHRRRRSSLAPTPSTPQRPHGYGLSRANFIGVYAPLLYTAEKTYASISRRGVSPSPTASPASVSSVSVAGSFEPTKGLNRTQSLIELNRSRGGMDIAVNGANLKAQPATHHLKTRRSLGSIQNPTAHQMLHSMLPLGQKPKEVPGAGRGRSPSASPKPHSAWVREKVQEDQALPVSTPAFGAHRRCASQSAMIGESSTSFSSPRAGTPPVQRGRPTRYQIPLPEQESPASSSAQAAGPSSSAASPGGRKRGKGKHRETSAPAPAERVLARPPTLNKFLQPSLLSFAQTVCTTVRPGLEATKSVEAMAAMVYARVDDDGAVERFEKEQGFV